MAMVSPARGPLVITPACAIPLAELRWRLSTSGGPGGQHANRSLTKVEVCFDVAASPSLDTGQRERLLVQLGPTVRAMSSERRSQAHNRVLALERLRSRLASGLQESAPRRPTRPGAGARERRLGAKRHQAQRKLRRRVDPEDA